MRDLGRLQRSLRADPVLGALPPGGDHAIRFTLGEDDFLVHTGDLSVRAVGGIDERWTMALVIPSEHWDRALTQPPPPGYTTVQAIVARVGESAVRGDKRRWAQYASTIERIVHALREAQVPVEAPKPAREPQTIGRYITFDVEDVEYRVFYESAGQGIPLVCLHTAGADARQYRYILEDQEITSCFRVIAFDMPWHGRSSPPPNWRSSHYELDVSWYAAVVRAFCSALEVESPVLMGCSMGGVLGLYMSSIHGDEFRAVCAIAGALEVRGRSVPWTRHTEVDHSLFVMEWMAGLFAPSSPPAIRDETLWQFAQSAPGVYSGDISILLRDPALRELQPASCPLYVFSGAYDFSATPQAVEKAAQQLQGRFIAMDSLGHFPICEDPVGFRQYLMPVLEDILGDSS